jgi:endonuclease/exonuclease/phosphatase (EEP) superfamily protein YafD
LQERLGASERLVLTSRNALLPLRRAVAIRWPDVIKSNGGGCNAILVRRRLTIVEHRRLRLCRLPERRWLHAVRLADGGWIGNLHAGGTMDEVRLAARMMLAWAGGAPFVLGGDFNVHGLRLDGLVWVGGQEPDHIFARGFAAAAGEAEVPDRGRLSDHAPLLAALKPAAPPWP